MNNLKVTLNASPTIQADKGATIAQLLKAFQSQSDALPVLTPDETRAIQTQLLEFVNLAGKYGWSFTVERPFLPGRAVDGQEVLAAADKGSAIFIKRVVHGSTPLSSDGGGYSYTHRQRERLTQPGLISFLQSFGAKRNLPTSQLPPPAISLTSTETAGVISALSALVAQMSRKTQDSSTVWEKGPVVSARALFAQLPSTAKGVALARVALAFDPDDLRRGNKGPDLAADLAGMTQIAFDSEQRFRNLPLEEAAKFAELTEEQSQEVIAALVELAGKLHRTQRGESSDHPVYETGIVQSARALYAQLSLHDQNIAIAKLAALRSPTLAADLSTGNALFF